MKRLFSMMMAFVLLVLTPLAIIIPVHGEHEPWDCPDCDRTGNKGNYCGECGHPAPWTDPAAWVSQTTVTLPVIVSQPQSTSAKIGDMVTFHAMVHGATSYKWEYSRGYGWMGLAYKSWASGQTTDSLTIKAFEGIKNYKYRLVASNYAGSVTSDEVTIIVKPTPTATIISQPHSISAKVGDKVTFQAKVQGATSYRWLYNSGKGWFSVPNSDWAKGQSSDSLTITVNEAQRDYKYKLEAKNLGGTVYTNEVTVSLTSIAPNATPIPIPVIISQPQSISARSGDKITFRAKVRGATSYCWQFYFNGSWISVPSGSWAKGTNSDSLSITVSYNDKEYIYRLKVQNSGGTVYSNEVTVNIVKETMNSTNKPSTSAPVFISQPQNATANSGTKVTLHATVRGATSYHWENSKGDGKWTRLGWDNWATGQKTDSLTVAVTPARRAYKFRLVAVNSWGSVKSNEVTITVK